MKESEPKDPNQIAEIEFEKLVAKADQERQAHSDAIQKEISEIDDINQLLARAEELVIYSNPLDPQYTNDSHSFIIEVRERLAGMEDGIEKDSLSQRLNVVYSKYCENGNL